MLQITKTTITREAVKQTPNGNYQIEYTVNEGTLTTLKCNITQNLTVPVPAENGTIQDIPQSVYIGNISLYSGNQVNFTFPYVTGSAKYLDDFDTIIAEITDPQTDETQTPKTPAK